METLRYLIYLVFHYTGWITVAGLVLTAAVWFHGKKTGNPNSELYEEFLKKTLSPWVNRWKRLYREKRYGALAILGVSGLIDFLVIDMYLSDYPPISYHVVIHALQGTLMAVMILNPKVFLVELMVPPTTASDSF